MMKRMLLSLLLPTVLLGIAVGCASGGGSHADPSVQMPETAVEKAIESLKALCEFAADRGLRMAVENLTSANMLMGRYPEELVQLVRGANMDNLGVCLDVGHANTTQKLDEFLDITAQAADVKIIHMHASDNLGEQDLHLPLGKGNLDWKKVLDGIQTNGYKGLVVLELYSLEDGMTSLEFLKNKTPSGKFRAF